MSIRKRIVRKLAVGIEAVSDIDALAGIDVVEAPRS